MGSAVAKRLTNAGCTVYTDLDGRSEVTRHRAKEAGMLDASLDEIVVKEKPGSNLFTETVKRIAGLLAGSGIKFIDAGTIAGPPKDGYDPTFYASVAVDDRGVLDAFVALSKYGLKGAGVGDASALKMSYAGISKGMTGLYTTMILAAHASSPATAEALVKELSLSQAGVLDRLVKSVPAMLPKAYRWVGEMEEIGEFVGGGEGDIYRGLARIYERVEKSLGGDQVDVEVLRKFVEDAKKTWQKK
ncbi:6-phosphogluconate dehydrogenase C-terminal domain-like protein [Imleria badia]|nr:6-phosphogluconate dehydrogenase C-terminal domain-like protein [Imleria badia]